MTNKEQENYSNPTLDLIKKFIDSNHHVLKNVPSWIENMLPEELSLDVFIKFDINYDWTRTQIFLFDVITHSETTISRINQLEFILENSHLQWKITNIPDCLIEENNIECPIKIFEYLQVSNIHQAYKVYKEQLQRGCTSILLRPPNGLYETGKSNNLLIWEPETKKEATESKL